VSIFINLKSMKNQPTYYIRPLKRILLRLMTTVAVSLSYITIANSQTLVTAPMTGNYTNGEYYSPAGITISPTTTITPGTGQSVYIHATPPVQNCTPLSNNFSQNQNYIVTSTPRIPGFTQGGAYGNCDVMQTVQYLDGLGRPVQTVQVKASPTSRDVVQPVAYDAYSREAIKYQPYVVLPTAASDGSFKTAAVTDALNFYSDPTNAATWNAPGVLANTFSYSQTVYEPSPLNRVLQQGASGNDWQPLGSTGVSVTAGHTVKTEYDINAASEVYQFEVNTTGAAINTTNNYYPAGQLFKTVVTDENGNQNITYKDKEDQVVCKSVQNGAGSFLSTYYIYDKLNNLRYVVPPVPAGITFPTSFAETDNVFLYYLYGYHYDNRNRLIEKKIPGKGWEYTVYNYNDKVAATQDALQRSKTTPEWTSIKYDNLGRVVLTGVYQDASATAGANNRTAVQSAVNALPMAESPVTTGTGYTAVAWPVSNILHNLAINYYDNYTYPSNPYTASVSNTLTAPAGLLTATQTAVLLPDGTYGSLLWTVHYYDGLGREAQTFKQHYLGGETSVSTGNYDEVASVYNFNNQPTQTTRHHYTGALALTMVNNYTYDQIGRKTQSFEQINSGSNTLVSQADYNEIGQLKTKHLHSTNNGGSFLQQVDYGYNERGWITAANSNGNLFNLALNYNNTISGVTPQFNGNIEQMQYTGVHSGSKTFAYTYDPLNRLANATSTGGTLDEGITYDNLGNITALTRGGTGNGSLWYSYTAGNQLSSVSGYTSRSYAYDANGNATSDGGSKNIAYNMFNLPGTVSTSGSTIATYTYDAGGQKLRNTGTDGSWDYIDGIVYHNGAIAFVATEEGRVVPNGGSYSYQYNLKDHLGNDRISFDTNPSDNTARVLQEDEYYSFGLRKNLYDFSNNNRYLYNGKEIQTDLVNQYDYGARFYDPIIGRWTTPDPLAEKLPGWSPYNYVLNNPMKLFDPDGLFPYPVTVRAFAPPGSFSGSGFDDDKRGFSASSNASSRLSQTTTINPVTGEVSGGHVTSTGTHFFGIPVGNAENFSSEGSVDRIGMSGSGDNHTLSVDEHLTGSDPAGLKLAPDVMLNSGISLTENDKAGYLDANITLTGKGFPASEALIGDTGGKNILLTGAATYGGLTSLIKNDPKQVASIGVRISIDGKGNFTGVSYNGKNYSVADWNKAQQAAPAGPHHNYSKQNIQGQTEQ
jgi:RHS repeat-associated protein